MVKFVTLFNLATPQSCRSQDSAALLDPGETHLAIIGQNSKYQQLLRRFRLFQGMYGAAVFGLTLAFAWALNGGAPRQTINGFGLSLSQLWMEALSKIELEEVPFDSLGMNDAAPGIIVSGPLSHLGGKVAPFCQDASRWQIAIILSDHKIESLNALKAQLNCPPSRLFVFQSYFGLVQLQPLAWDQSDESALTLGLPFLPALSAQETHSLHRTLVGQLEPLVILTSLERFQALQRPTSRPATPLELALLSLLITSFSVLSTHKLRPMAIKSSCLQMLLILTLCLVAALYYSVVLPLTVIAALSVASLFLTFTLSESLHLRKLTSLELQKSYKTIAADQQNSFLMNLSEEMRQDIARMHGALTTPSNLVPSPVIKKWQTEAEASLAELSQYVDIIDNFRRVVQKEAGIHSTQQVSVLMLLDRIAVQVSSALKGQELKLNISCQATEVIHSDETLIEQILMNLVGNAIKYSPQGSTIWLSFERTPQEVLFTVKDEGPGIDPQFQEKIFERFFRVEAATKTGTKGNGLGLYLSRYFARLLNGDIFVDSALQKGSSFSLRIPQDLP